MFEPGVSIKEGDALTNDEGGLGVGTCINM